ncbi:MAG: M20/M25/M40 family metallo-hydrolase, partial [Anaerolineaceae bacterium]|nr:M20/M25/M40 family metallo-hydrolase [Anaerolineaceae bacterium]
MSPHGPIPLFREEIHQGILELACDFQQIPAPTHAESQRATRVCTEMEQAGLLNVCIDSAGNACARLPGVQQRRPLVVSAHLDTVFPAATDLSLSFKEGIIAGPGIGDNSTGLAGMFGLAWLLKERGALLPGDVWLIATVGEEGLGNLKGMHAVVNRFGSQPLAYLVLEGMGL